MSVKLGGYTSVNKESMVFNHNQIDASNDTSRTSEPKVGEVRWVVNKIGNNPTDEHLGHPLMQAFTTKSAPLHQAQCLINLHTGDQEFYVNPTPSPNGQYIACVTLSKGTFFIVDLNLYAEAYSRFSSVNARARTAEEEDKKYEIRQLINKSATEIDIDYAFDLPNFHDHKKTFKENPKNPDHVRDCYLKSIHITWLPDSKFVALTCPDGIKIYSVDLCFLNNESSTNHIEVTKFKETTRIKFQYIQHETMGSDWYTPLDSAVLVTGTEKGVYLTTLLFDNMTPATAFPKHNFHSTFKMPDLYAATFNGELKDTMIWHNKSDYLYAEVADHVKRTIKVYKIDTKHPKAAKRFQFKYQIEVPGSIIYYPKTFSASGLYVWCYNPKRSEIQIMQLDKFKLETKFKLTGKRKNLKQFAVKEDGKYILVVDNTYNADLLMRNAAGQYDCLFSYNVNIANGSANAEARPGMNKFKGVDEHDLSSLEILEDGSGFINSSKASIKYQRFRMPKQRLNECITLNQHFFDTKFHQNYNGTLTYFDESGRIHFQKSIDFESPAPRVKTIRTNQVWEVKDVFVLGEDIRALLPSQENLKTAGYGGYQDQNDQITELITDNIMADAKVIPIPECPFFVVHLKSLQKIIGYRFTSVDDSSKYLNAPEIAWIIILKDEEPGANSEFVCQNCNFNFGNHGKYIIVPMNEKGGRIYEIKENHGAELVPLAEIPTGQTFHIVSPDLVLVVDNPEKHNDYDSENPGSVDVNEVFVTEIKLFSISRKEFVSEALERKAKSAGIFTFPRSADMFADRYTIIPGLVNLMLFDTEAKQITVEDTVFLPADEVFILTNEAIDSHGALVAPNGKTMVVCSISAADDIFVYSLPELKRKTVLTIKGRPDRLNRWCYTHDSKYFLLVKNNEVWVYSTDDFKKLTSIPLDDELFKYSKILRMNVRKESTELEFCTARQNIIYFRRIPLYPTKEDLLTSTIQDLLQRYSDEVNHKDQIAQADTIANLINNQPQYQKYLDSTYVKLVCLYNDMLLNNKSLATLDKDIIFKYSPYANFIQNQKEQKDFLNDSVNCFIDLMEKCMTDDKKFPAVQTETLLDWLRGGKLQIKYSRKLVNIISLEPLNLRIAGEPQDELMLMSKISPENPFRRTKDWLEGQKKLLLKENSPNITHYNCFRTGVDFDLSNGSTFSMEYFRWVEDASDEDLTTIYKAIVYYKWSRVYKVASAYSVLFWILNGLLVAFMGFAPYSLGLMIPIIVLSGLFIIYEIKCFASNFSETVTDVWNYVDLVTHMYSIACVVIVKTLYTDDPLDNNHYRLAWLRGTSVVLVSIRGLTMLRIFRGTRYLITMLFAVFYEMVAFLSVFGYVIFIYWFVCLVRPSLVMYSPDDEVIQENFYSSVKQALNIAFSNFDAEVDSVIILVTSIMGNIVLGLVLLNYLIAIVSKTYETVAEHRDLHDLKMVLTLIREFDSFFAGLRLDAPEKQTRYFILVPVPKEDEQMNQIKQLVKEEFSAAISKIDTGMAALEANLQTNDTNTKEALATMGETLEKILKSVNSNQGLGIGPAIHVAKSKADNDIQMKGRVVLPSIEASVPDIKMRRRPSNDSLIGEKISDKQPAVKVVEDPDIASEEVDSEASENLSSNYMGSDEDEDDKTVIPEQEEEDGLF